MAAATQALQDADWMPEDDEDQFRTGVMVGSGIGGLPSIEEASVVLHLSLIHISEPTRPY